MTDGLKAALKAGKPQIGSYVTFPSPEIVELFAAAGMDYVVIDLQHSSPDWQTLAHMIRAAEARRISPIVRVYSHEPALLLKVLEQGAEGISLPGVRNAADVRAAVDAIYYSPIGRRGACGHTRVAGYNSRRSDFSDHVRRQHERVLIWALIEDPEAITNVEEIASVRPGADLIGVGRGDLSVALGLPGQIDHPTVIEAAEKVIQQVASRSRGECGSSVMVHGPNEIAGWFARGCRMFTYAADAIMLMNTARDAVRTCRQALSSISA
jgi:2-keto-3-deoxy-L-rhamnonate aldolase RhmA